jgi:hypothetical protein
MYLLNTSSRALFPSTFNLHSPTSNLSLQIISQVSPQSNLLSLLWSSALSHELSIVAITVVLCCHLSLSSLQSCLTTSLMTTGDTLLCCAADLRLRSPQSCLAADFMTTGNKLPQL